MSKPNRENPTLTSTLNCILIDLAYN